MLMQIPMELRQLPQWAIADMSIDPETGKPRKRPLNPRTGQPASTTDPKTWGTFEEALRSGSKHIGIMLTRTDPYCIIDLDDPYTKKGYASGKQQECAERNAKIVDAFESYAEISASHQGVHIIVKAKTPAGAKRDTVEVYSSERFMICTGNVIANYPITDAQELVDQLYAEMASERKQVALQTVQGRSTDEEVVTTASRAANADKFNRLCAGHWQGEYPSQSEADFALLSILAFYTPDNDQVRRLFRMSTLGKREKAIKNDTYLNRCLSKIRANEPSPVDFTTLTENMQTKTSACFPDAKEATTAIAPPPGLIGELSQYIYAAAIRPVPEIALAAAIALTAGIAGRSYNVSGSGLNQYLVMLARTGSGKESAVSGIDALIAAVRPSVPMVDQFIGPGTFASGQALIRVLDKQPCFVSVLGEFGLTLQQLCDPRANVNQIMLRKVLLDLYSKSGWNKMLRPSVYSDVEKNTNLVQAPNVTILGESTPETFFDGLDTSHIAEGLIPRFSVIEYNGPRPARNQNAFTPPPQALTKRLVDLVTVVFHTQANMSCAPVQIDARSAALLDDFDRFADKQINGAHMDIQMQLWNRAHLKALKLSALVAVGCNLHQPIVTQEITDWSVDFVRRDIGVMLNRYHGGNIGTGDHRHESDVRQAVEEYLQMAPGQRVQYKTPKALLDQPVVPFHYLRRRLRLRVAFKNDKRGVVKALEEALRDMVKAEILQLIPVQQSLNQFGVSSELYVKGATW